MVGIYSVLSFSISRRTREMGIRMALGAERQHVFVLVVRDGMLLVLVGVLLGLGAALATSRSLSAFLFGVSTTDLPTFAGTVGILCAVALIACAIPARKAVGLNPVTALRQE
jgi:putative ABC transport system permease protein